MARAAKAKAKAEQDELDEALNLEEEEGETWSSGRYGSGESKSTSALQYSTRN